MMRICVFAERLALPFDEGIKNYTQQLITQLASRCEVLPLTCYGQDIPQLSIENVSANPLLLSPALRRRIRQFDPHVVIYVPTACATLFSFARSRMLHVHARGAPVFMMALQVRQYGLMARMLMPHLCPELVMVQSELTERSLMYLPCSLSRLSPGIDLEKFRPVCPTKKTEIRVRHSLPLDASILLHVGHLNQGRNILALSGLQSVHGQQVVVVGSSSTPHDKELVDALRHRGVRVIDDYVANIAELYQAADCYLFPVQNETSAIDMPLSILEAMACNIPVVATRFGALGVLANVKGVYLQDDPSTFQQAIDRCYDQPIASRQWIEQFGWDRVINDLVARISDQCPIAEE